MSYREDFARALHAFRLSRGWTLEEMSRVIRWRERGRGPSAQTLGQWERGVHFPLRKWFPLLLRIGFVPPPRPQPSVPTRTRFR